MLGLYRISVAVVLLVALTAFAKRDDWRFPDRARSLWHAIESVASDLSLLRVIEETFTYTEGSGDALTGSRGETVTTARASTRICDLDDGTMGSPMLQTNEPCVAGDPLELSVWTSTTNRLLWSESITPGVWVKSGNNIASYTITIDAATDLRGNLNAERHQLPAMTETQSGIIYQDVTPGSATSTFSCYVHGRAAVSTFYLYTYQSGMKGATQCQVSAGEWKRCSHTATGLNTGAAATWAVGNDANTAEMTAQDAADFDLWGCQVENGGFPTPYIPTAGTQVTRAGEQHTVSTPAGAGTPATFCFGATINHTTGGGWVSGVATRGIMAIRDSALNTNFQSLYVNSSGVPRYDAYDSAGAVKFVLGSSALTDGEHRVVACNASGTLSIYVDGASVSGSPSGAGTGAPSAFPGTVALGSFNNTASSLLNGNGRNFCFAIRTGVCETWP